MKSPKDKGEIQYLSGIFLFSGPYAFQIEIDGLKKEQRELTGSGSKGKNVFFVEEIQKARKRGWMRV